MDLQRTVSINEEGITMLSVSDIDLMDFPRLIDNVEKLELGKKEGVFVLRINEEDRTTSLQELLQLLEPGLRNCFSQIFSRTPWYDGIYLYTATASNGQSQKAFVTKAMNPESYTGESSCSKILQWNGANALAQHYFDVISSVAIVKTSGRSSSVASMDFKTEYETLLEQGKYKKKLYDDKRKLLSSSCGELCEETRSPPQKKPVWEKCECPDCFTEVEEDSEEDYIPKKKKLKLKKNLKTREILYSAGMSLPDKKVQVTAHFSLSQLTSILDILDSDVDGVQLSHFYVGEEFSTFVAHVEDGAMWAINYLHCGLPKCWFAIAPEYMSLVEKLLHQSILNLSHTSCNNILGHKAVLLTSKFLKEYNIPFNIVIQKVGDAVVLYPNTIHFGFNLGINVAEAVNFATESWIPLGLEAKRCRCFSDSQIHVDMRGLVAAFRPDLLKSVLMRKPLTQQETISDQAQQSIQDAIEPDKEEPDEEEPDEEEPDEEGSTTEDGDAKEMGEGRKRKDKILMCPEETCQKFYLEHRARLIEHIRKNHQEKVKKLIDIVDEKYPSFQPKGEKTHCCSVCGKWFSGSKTHLEKHMRRSLNSPKLVESKKEQYRNALEELQKEMANKRRRTFHSRVPLPKNLKTV